MSSIPWYIHSICVGLAAVWFSVLVNSLLQYLKSLARNVWLGQYTAREKRHPHFSDDMIRLSKCAIAQNCRELRIRYAPDYPALFLPPKMRKSHEILLLHELLIMISPTGHFLLPSHLSFLAVPCCFLANCNQRLVTDHRHPHRIQRAKTQNLVVGYLKSAKSKTTGI